MVKLTGKKHTKKERISYLKKMHPNIKKSTMEYMYHNKYGRRTYRKRK